MDNIRIFGTVNRAQKSETFLSAVSVDRPGAQALLLELFKDRMPRHCVSSMGVVMLLRDGTPIQLHDVISWLGDRKAMIGRHDGEVFIAVKFSHKRLMDSLINSAKTFRQNAQRVRPIENERDLLNSHVAIPSRVYKDD